MNITKPIQALMSVITEEANRNPEFAQKLAVALGLDKVKRGSKRQTKRHRGRRTPAVLDPIALYSEGDRKLREKLGVLDIEQLRDIVAEYGMDPGKLVMKWKVKERITDHIVKVASARAKKGDAFR